MPSSSPSSGGQALSPRDHATRLDESGVGAGRVAHCRVAQAHELVDVELVVGEQHEVLEMIGRGAGVVAQPVQRVIHARCGEQRQRLPHLAVLAGLGLISAVGNPIVHRGEVGQVEQVPHQQAARRVQRAFEVVVLGQRKMHRDRLRAGTDLDGHLVVAQQQVELLSVVVAEQVGPRQRGLEESGACDEAETQARVGARHGVGAHAYIGVAGAHPRGQSLSADEAPERIAKVGHVAVVDAAHMGHRRVGVVKVAGGDVSWGDRHGRAFR